MNIGMHFAAFTQSFRLKSWCEILFLEMGYVFINLGNCTAY